MAATTPNPTSTPPPGSTPSSDLAWDRPGPGTWELDSSHFEADCSRLAQRLIEYGMGAGTADGFELIGAPLRCMEARFVNGNFYRRLVPLVGGDRDAAMPPAPILWLATRLHPAFRRRTRVAAKAMTDRLWNQELSDWVRIHKPGLIEQCRSLAAVDPAALSDEALADHLDRAVEVLMAGTRLHFRLHISDLGPIGLLLVRGRDWGFDGPDIMATLAGHSPATSAPVKALAEIRGLAAHAAPFTELDQVRAVSPEAAAAVDQFIAEFGWRLTTGYDLQERTLAEMPGVMLASINADSTDEHDRAATGAERADAAADRLRERVPAQDRAEFDRMVDEARDLYGLRDENGPLTYQWPAGLTRRSMLEAGRRMTADGRIGHPDHVFDLEPEELTALLRSTASDSAGSDRALPDVAELDHRLAERLERKRHTAPKVLGPEPEDPPISVMPAPLARWLEVVTAVVAVLETEETESTLDGLGVGTEPYEGRALVVTDDGDALARIEPGDVLIAPFTVPTYNAALAVAGAVVVEHGGLLCHAAVIARELGIPGIVGVTGVTGQITDGATVRVDPVAGTIREVPATG